MHIATWSGQEQEVEDITTTVNWIFWNSTNQIANLIIWVDLLRGSESGWGDQSNGGGLALVTGVPWRNTSLCYLPVSLPSVRFLPYLAVFPTYALTT